ncbi:hypothetical protein [Dyadobacter sp. NIV53]|uniref:hypothetical protein n=1 Tax=Dyadobacter sp. NIV53 TaxID=2861765 RepID=UPI001C87027F|nr:hypothetical protein [Dyadobacter sp. NIV53]
MSDYVLRIIKFTCVDESGIDFLGSDEPFWIFTAKVNNGEVNTASSRQFGDVDSGNTEKFLTDNNRNIIWPKKGAVQGAPGPIGLSIQLWDKDQGAKDTIEKQTEKAFDLGSQAPIVGDWVRRVPSIVRNQISAFIGDDLMSSKTVLFTNAQLDRHLRNVGSKLKQKIRFGGTGGDLPFEVAGGPDYDLFIEVERVS